MSGQSSAKPKPFVNVPRLTSVNHADGKLRPVKRAAPESAEKGTISPVAVLGIGAPQGGKIHDVRGALLNNKNSSALVLAATAAEGRLDLYRFADGKLTSMVLPGQTLPDGGQLVDIPLTYYCVSPANELGGKLTPHGKRVGRP